MLIPVLVTINLVAQVPYFEHIQLQKSREPLFVNAMFQDSKGFLWYASAKGLFKYDGTALVPYASANGLPEQEVTALGEDSTGHIWVGFKNGHLGFLENGIFQSFDPPEGQATAEISDIIFDRRGNLWFSTLNDGLYYFSASRLNRLDESDGMPDIFVYDIVEDKNGNIWAGTDGGLVRCRLNQRKISIDVFDYRDGLPDNIIKKIDIEGETLLLETEDSGIIQFLPATQKISPVIPGKWKYGVTTDFIRDEDKIWISSQQKGLIIYDRRTKQSQVFDSRSGPGFTSILTLLKDREGNIWAGTKTDVMRSRGDLVEFIDRYDPLKDVNTLAIAVDANETIWFSTHEGLFRRTVRENRSISIEGVLQGTPYQKFSVISLYADDAGFVWAGLYGEGLLRIHIKTGDIRYLNKELTNGNVLHITGKGNTIWLATLGGGTRIHISGNQLEVKNYTSDDGLVSAYIYEVFVDSQDRVWFGTDGKGADMLDNNGFHHYENLAAKVVYGFAEDYHHRLWANIQGEGLYRLENEKFIAFDSGSVRLRSNNISCFSATPSGNLFIMHDLGIEILDVEADKILSLGEESGVDGKIPNLNAIAVDHDGHVYAGTEQGIVKYSEKHDHYLSGPQPIIESMSVLKRPVGFDEVQDLRHNQNDITINFIGLWYQNAKAVNYQYKLDNYDREWITTQDHFANYARLSPGTYTFRVRASDTQDFQSTREANVTFTIRAPFWQTWWFYLISAFFLLLLGRMFLLYRERSLREDKRVLESRITERTHEIIRQSNEINNQAEAIKGINENLEDLVRKRTVELEKKNKALEEYAFINAHELRAPVASILGLIQLMEILHEKEDRREYLDHLRSSAEKLDGVVRSIGKAIEKGE